MKKFLRWYRTAKDSRERKEREERRDELLSILRNLINVGGYEAEPEYVEVVKQIHREQFGIEIGKDELKDRIRQFRAAVSERQSRAQESS